MDSSRRPLPDVDEGPEGDGAHLADLLECRGHVGLVLRSGGRSEQVAEVLEGLDGLVPSEGGLRRRSNTCDVRTQPGLEHYDVNDLLECPRFGEGALVVEDVGPGPPDGVVQPKVSTSRSLRSASMRSLNQAAFCARRWMIWDGIFWTFSRHCSKPASSIVPVDVRMDGHLLPP